MGIFDGRVALVTGGGSGIGRAAALGLAADGATVIIAGRAAASLAQTVAMAALPIRAVQADVSSPQEVRALFEDIARNEGRVDILVNSHGIYPQASLAECDLDAWRYTIEVNLVGCANLFHFALPGMLSRDWGRIITLGSRSARSPGAVTSAYSASKAGVEALTLSLSHELLWRRTGRPNVQANVLIPGQTVTGLIPVPPEQAARHQKPDAVYPYLRELVSTSRYAPSGCVFYRGRRVAHGDAKLRLKQLRANLLTRLGLAKD